MHSAQRLRILRAFVELARDRGPVVEVLARREVEDIDDCLLRKDVSQGLKSFVF